VERLGPAVLAGGAGGAGAGPVDVVTVDVVTGASVVVSFFDTSTVPEVSVTVFNTTVQLQILISAIVAGA
jgi:hypothetical protein